MTKKKNIIGIIGRIASGKSFAGRFFESLGATFVDCDAIVANLYKKGNIGAKKIETFFGDEFLKKGAVNKARLGIFVSKDQKKLRILEKIVHPLVLCEIQKAIDKSQKETIFIEIGAPSEKFLHLCKKIILIETPKKQRLPRIRTKYLEKIDNFKDLKSIKPDFLIKNTGNKKTFGQNLQKVYNQITGRAKGAQANNK